MKEFKKRLERALKELSHSGGVTLGSLVAQINKHEPQFSIRKILEGLKACVDEGLLSMDGGKLRLSPKYGDALGDCKLFREEPDGFSLIGKYSDGTVSIGDCRSVKRLDTTGYASVKDKKIKKIVCRGVKRKYEGKRKNGASKCLGTKSASENKVDRESDLVFSERDKDNLRKPLSVKIEYKRRRGPRCTSMKKEVKMPSRVHIPWTPQPAPQRDLMHNELLRKSPDPMVGPLFDDSKLVPDDALSGSFDSPFL